MVKSMTGYGKVTKNLDFGEVSVEVRSLNNRFIEVYLKVPDVLSDFEDEFKKYVVEKLCRGSVKIVIRLSLKEETEVGYIHLNIPLMKRYYDELLRAKKELGIRGKVNLQHVLEIADYSELTVPEMDGSRFYDPVREALKEAVEDLIRMRIEEGKYIAARMREYLDEVEEKLGRLKEIYERNRAHVFKRLKERISEFVADLEVDEVRIVQEAGILSKKIDITEECDRLFSHVSQFRRFLESSEPVGKKMMFLIQEMNREITTVGSKSEDVDISHLVVEIKDVFEKLREQAQNIL